MRRLWIGVGLLFTIATGARAQIPAPGAELFGGYSYTRISSSGSGFNANGWEGSITGNFNRIFGLEADFSQHYDTPQSTTFFTSNSLSAFGPHSNGFTFLFGPHLAFRAFPRVNPFVHFLAGGTRGTANFVGPVPLAGATIPCVMGQTCPFIPFIRPPNTETAFTTAAGWGLDVKATRFIWIRAVQVDYLRQLFTNDNQNVVRLSAGVVFRFGS